MADNLVPSPESNERKYSNARRMLDEQFGLGIREAHEAINTIPAARAIYECALRALVRQMENKT